MLKWWRNWRENRHLERLGWPDTTWENAVAGWPVAQGYQGEQRRRLRDTAVRFLLRKPVVAASDMELDDSRRLLIATMAAVPILGLDLDWYANWYTIIVYPRAFTPPGEVMDDYGVVHSQGHPLAGEAWSQGPVILSWDDVERASRKDGYNVVIHELAHKLDMRQDGPNGAPPMHRGMDPKAWTRDFTAAWEELEAEVEAHGEDSEHLLLDPYALVNPGEFFAVVSEAFFEKPERLRKRWPAVYHQLSTFYRQDPADAGFTPT